LAKCPSKIAANSVAAFLCFFSLASFLEIKRIPFIYNKFESDKR